MNCIICGSGSDIAQGLKERLQADGWTTVSVSGHSQNMPEYLWDMIILCHGQLSPIGKFMDCDYKEWINSLVVNAYMPLAALRDLWQYRKPDARVIFLGGPNLSHPTPTYTAYRAGKAIIESMVDTLAIEYPEVKFRILHPGVVKTKIHQQTLQAGHRAANYERVFKIVNGMESTVSHDEVYAKLKALM